MMEQYLSGLEASTALALYVDRILAREGEEAGVGVEQQTVIAVFLLRHAASALDVLVALVRHWVAPITFRAFSGEESRLHGAALAFSGN